MILLSILLLAVGLIAGYISLNHCDEMASLIGLLSAISLLFSLIFAPWQFQMLLLVFLLIKH